MLPADTTCGDRVGPVPLECARNTSLSLEPKFMQTSAPRHGRMPWELVQSDVKSIGLCFFEVKICQRDGGLFASVSS
jgi:hypothetical protein